MESSTPTVRRTIAEKRRIVELTLQPGQSVARVAQAEGVNSHQVFQWRRLYRQGGLVERAAESAALLAVIVSEGGKSVTARDRAQEPDPKPLLGEQVTVSTGAIHIDLGDHPKAAIDDRVKSGHREMA